MKTRYEFKKIYVDKDVDPSNFNELGLLNEAGAEGWRPIATRDVAEFAIYIMMREIEADMHGKELESQHQWNDMNSAPKGGTDPEYITPPSILLLFENGKQVVGSWDWYYAESGGMYQGCSAWVSDPGGELLAMYYDEPIGWQPLPKPPEGK